jgi:hypothetical protein
MKLDKEYMLTPKQADKVADALLVRPDAPKEELLQCPACYMESIPVKARANLHTFGSLSCPTCGVKLRLAWARPLFACYLATIIAVGILYFNDPSTRALYKLLAPIFTAVATVGGLAERKLPLRRV